ncbi:UDP-glycosyltransferase 89B2 [Salvia miltiorrhiza]|uniref:UDP-glycosyltransferase 89B2 n=1 Tax=Salvia miltiorrhiza TaxID=226208 RepID=UPI0025AB9A2C|nr:UDP-glycosyltransferase 89B2 [Salvia miltiorrhiza]
MHAHVLVFPFPAQGHMIPLLDFTAQIAAAGLSVTVVVTPKNLPSLDRVLAAHPASITALVLPFPPHPALPAAAENLSQLPPDAFRFVLRALGDLRDPLLRWFRSHPSPPAAIISDLFLGWTHHLARQLGIRRYVFCPCGALAASIINSLWCEMPTRRNRHDDDEATEFPRIPNSPFYPWWQLSPLYRSYAEGDPVLEFIKDSFRANALSDGLILNTFLELEGVYLDYLAKELGHDRIWPIGPLLPPIEIGPVDRGGSSTVSISQISTWLDTCQDGTVVYVCFGSQTILSNKQLEELSLGLEKSGVKFILVVKDVMPSHNESDDYGMIPTEFENRVVGRGVVIRGWAPQVAILRHRAVCAFLTHCGWNSTLESIAAGVPMMAWPMGADQFANATLIENELGIAVRVYDGDEAAVDSNDVARHLVEATTSEKWMERRARAMALGKAARDATARGGSSFNNLDHFVSYLSKLHQ